MGIGVENACAAGAEPEACEGVFTGFMALDIPNDDCIAVPTGAILIPDSLPINDAPTLGNAETPGGANPGATIPSDVGNEGLRGGVGTTGDACESASGDNGDGK